MNFERATGDVQRQVRDAKVGEQMIVRFCEAWVYDIAEVERSLGIYVEDHLDDPYSEHTWPNDLQMAALVFGGDVPVATKIAVAARVEAFRTLLLDAEVDGTGFLCRLTENPAVAQAVAMAKLSFDEDWEPRLDEADFRRLLDRFGFKLAGDLT